MNNPQPNVTKVIVPETYFWEPVAQALRENLSPIDKAKDYDLIGLSLIFRGGMSSLLLRPIQHALLANGPESRVKYRYGFYPQLEDKKAATVAHLAMMLQSDTNLCAIFEPIALAMALAEDSTAPEFVDCEAHVFRDGIVFSKCSSPSLAGVAGQPIKGTPEILPEDLCLIAPDEESNHKIIRRQKNLNQIVDIWNTTHTI